MKKAVLVIILGVINAIYAFASLLDMWISQLVDPSQVFDDYGYDFNGSDTFTIWLISGIIVLFIGIFMFQDYKKKSINN